MASEEIIHTCKHYIDMNYIDECKIFIQDLSPSEDWTYVFQKVYLHACLKGRKQLAEWLEKDVYPLLEPIQQIALRQIFPYGHHLLSRA